jgi:hypothetical protein
MCNNTVLIDIIVIIESNWYNWYNSTSSDIIDITADFWHLIQYDIIVQIL